jgi:antitoxin ParD1/3/4
VGYFEVKFAFDTNYWYLCEKIIMSKNTSILLGDHFEGFISKKIKSGRFHSASEVIRAGLRLLEFEEWKIEELKSAIEKGEQSGIAQNFNATSHLKSLRLKNE